MNEQEHRGKERVEAEAGAGAEAEAGAGAGAKLRRATGRKNGAKAAAVEEELNALSPQEREMSPAWRRFYAAVWRAVGKSKNR